MTQLAHQVRRLDRERFVTTLFAPEDARESLLALYAFNAEVARVRESVRESMAGMIRLQWWREALAGERPAETVRHPVAAPLIAACRAHKVSGEAFERLLDARERDLSPQVPADLEELEGYAADTSATITQLALELLDARDEASLAAGKAVGTAFALVGLLRSVPYQIATGRLMLPADALRQAGVDAEAVMVGTADPGAVATAAKPVGERARALLAEARRHKTEKRALAALLPAVLTSGHLRDLERGGWNVFDPRLKKPRTMPVRLAVNALLRRY
ncbi:MAG TPA: phytoene/squalene synthase family protein [Candidatus Omnitrophota bacterium]|nr:phytoene/squalene synthase family protein [Candidatus Omnitrophota bacterium]